MKRLWNRLWPFIKTVQHVFVPPKGTDDWQRIAYQPMLYLCLWIAAIVILIKGDFAAIPPIFKDETTGSTYWLWTGLSLICPPIALASLWLIQQASGVWKYRGLWTRLGADFGQLIALVIYTWIRFAIGDWHVYPQATLIASTLFVAHLVLRDAERLFVVERLATKLHRIKSDVL